MTHPTSLSNLKHQSTKTLLFKWNVTANKLLLLKFHISPWLTFFTPGSKKEFLSEKKKLEGGMNLDREFERFSIGKKYVA